MVSERGRMVDEQGLKDTFYAVMRDRVAAGNAGRTCVVRGTVRPGVVVVENELPGAMVDGISVMDAFCLRWLGLRVDALGMMAATCEVKYATEGDGSAGMDRGRALAAMDGELRGAVSQVPMHTDGFAVSEVSGGGASVETPVGTRVWWGDVAFGAVVMRGERMERTATVEVFGYGG